MKKIIAWTVAAAAVLAVGGIIAWSFSVSGNERAAKVKVRGNGATTQLTSSPDATVRSEQAIDLDGTPDTKQQLVHGDIGGSDVLPLFKGIGLKHKVRGIEVTSHTGFLHPTLD